MAHELRATATEPPSPELPGQASTRSPGRSFKQFLDKAGGYWTLGILVLIIIVMGLVAPTLFTKAAWLSTANYSVEFLILAVGQTYVIILAEIDISDGAVLGFSALTGSLVMSGLLDHHVGGSVTTLIGILIMLGVGTCIGVVNGILRVCLKISSFIVTIAMMLAIGFGAINLITSGASIDNLPNGVLDTGSDSLFDGWLPISVLVAIVIAVVFGLVLARTRFGLRVYMIGSNPLAARRAGIKVNRYVVACFGLSGLLAGVAGFLVTANLTIATPIAGQNDEFYAITAVVIGGASLFGGRGGIFGTFIGTAVLAVLTTGLVLANVQTYWQYVAIGAVLVAAVGIDQVRTRVAG
jgi:ribose transport system permease protein